jgi:hypothetical protein
MFRKGGERRGAKSLTISIFTSPKRRDLKTRRGDKKQYILLQF